MRELIHNHADQIGLGTAVTSGVAAIFAHWSEATDIAQFIAAVISSATGLAALVYHIRKLIEHRKDGDK